MTTIKTDDLRKRFQGLLFYKAGYATDTSYLIRRINKHLGVRKVTHIVSEDKRKLALKYADELEESFKRNGIPATLSHFQFSFEKGGAT